METYDVAVLGGGPGGYVAGLRASQRGAKVCCVEAGRLGGACLNVGCIPTKVMLRASQLFAEMGRCEEFGFAVSGLRVDGASFMQRVERTVTGLGKGLEFLLKARKVDVVRGRGRLVARDTLAVDMGGETQQITAKSIIVATGSRPVRPGFVDWDSPRVWTTDEASTAKALPDSVLIIGGGIIGCEFATAYSELGIPTTIVEMLDRLVSNLDEDAAKVIYRSLKRRGVKILTGVEVVAMTANDSGVLAKLSGGETIEASCALVAVGRVPNIENIGLEETGVELTDGIIEVDDHCRTNVEGIYAVGDVAEKRQYAHLASRMGIIAADNATGHDHCDDRRVVPACVYTHPEVATLGLSEAEARSGHNDVRIGQFPYQASGMAHAYGEKEGLVKIIGDAGDGKILGAVVIGQHATDVIAELAAAMRNSLTIDQLAETIHAHPTFAEAIAEAADDWLGLPLHTVGTARRATLSTEQ